MARVLLILILMLTFLASARADDSVALPPGVVRSSAGFYHPGVLVNRPQLEFVKTKIAAGMQPWKSAFDAARSDPLGSLAYPPHPWKSVTAGPYSRPDLGAKDEQHDSEAAYTQALLWFYSGNPAYAENAIKIMNAWSAMFVG